MKPIRLLAILEAGSVTGPAKNLLQFARLAGSGLCDPPVAVVIGAFVRGEPANPFVAAAREAGLPVHLLPERRRYDCAVIGALRSLAEEVKPDLVQTHAVKSHFLARLAGLHHLAPWIAFHHGYTWPDLRARLYNQLDRWSLRAATRVVTVSLPFREELVRRGVAAGRIEVVHNAIDPDWGVSKEGGGKLRERLGIEGSKKIVLSVGRLSREKDHATLLEGFHRMCARGAGAGAHLLIVGDGPERPSIESAIRALHLAPEVTLTGQVPSAQPYYAIADAVVLSSRSEGSPNALLEAMAARVPVVATAVGGVPEIVTSGESALLVEPGNPGSLAEAMALVLSDQELAHRLAANAFERVAERHSPPARARQLLQLYCRVLDRAANVVCH